MAGHINVTIAPERIVIVGASLAGLRAAEALRREGFVGQLTLIGDEHSSGGAGLSHAGVGEPRSLAL